MTIQKQADKLPCWFAARGGSFYRGKSGAVAIIFALAILPLMMMVGAAVDYSRATSAANRLGEAADDGALAAAQAATQAIAAGNANWNAVGVAAGQNVFSANAMGLTTTAAPTIVVTQVGVGATARLTVAGEISTSIMGLVGVPTMTFTKSATATSASPTSGSGSVHANISLVLDVSPSMAIAASAADMTNLEALTAGQKDGPCAFACHDSNGNSVTNYSIARSNNVTLRMDIVKSAAQALTAYVANANTTPGQYTMGLYTMSWRLQTLVAPTSNLTSVSTAIGDVDFDQMSLIFPHLPAPAASNVASGDGLEPYADSDFGASIATLNTLVPAGKSGSSASAPQQYVSLCHRRSLRHRSSL